MSPLAAIGPLLSLAAAAPWTVAGTTASDVGWDTNVYRNFEGVNDPSLPGGGAVIGDGFLQLNGDLDVSGRPWAHQETDLAAQLGARLFATQGGENTVLAAAQLAHAIGLTRKLTLRFDLSAKDKWVENDDRAYATGNAGAGLSIGPWWHTRFDVRAGYQGFDYVQDSDFSEQGPSVSALVVTSPWPKQSLQAGYRLVAQFYQGPQLTPAGPTGSQRFDWYHVATAGYSLRGPVVLSASYSFIDDQANSYGESFLRHRLEILAGVILPGDVYLVGGATIQLTSYPDGLYLSPELLLLEDDDDLDDVTVKLSRDLGKGFSVEARYAYYRNDLFQSGLTYERQAAYVGVAWRH